MPATGQVGTERIGPRNSEPLSACSIVRFLTGLLEAGSAFLPKFMERYNATSFATASRKFFIGILRLMRMLLFGDNFL